MVAQKRQTTNYLLWLLYINDAQNENTPLPMMLMGIAVEASGKNATITQCCVFADVWIAGHRVAHNNGPLPFPFEMYRSIGEDSLCFAMSVCVASISPLAKYHHQSSLRHPSSSECKYSRCYIAAKEITLRGILLMISTFILYKEKGLLCDDEF
jgi:hypothetical protein